MATTREQARAQVVDEPTAQALIQAKARRLCRQGGFSPSEQEDVEQELWLAVLQQVQQFDPTRASLETFLDRVVSRAAAALLRSRRRQKRGNGVQPLSLDNGVQPLSLDNGVTHTSGEEPESLSDTVSPADVARRLGTQFIDPIAQLEQTEAVEHALARMPERLRDICQRLMAGQSKASIAREQGMSRHQMRKAIEAARSHLEEAGLENS